MNLKERSKIRRKAEIRDSLKNARRLNEELTAAIEAFERENDTPLNRSERRNLGRMYQEWADEYGIDSHPVSVISWLQDNGAINAAAARTIIMEKNV